METATKKGRPRKFDNEVRAMFPEMTDRQFQNFMYAMEIVQGLLRQKPGDFFITEKGKYRRQGIAEKIGRLYCSGYLSEDETRQLVEAAIEDYNNGATVKEIERSIKRFAENYFSNSNNIE